MDAAHPFATSGFASGPPADGASGVTSVASGEAGRVTPMILDGSTSSAFFAAGASIGGHVTVIAVSSYAIAGCPGGGGGGTSGTTVRRDTGPLRPRVEMPTAAYVRVGTAPDGPSSGRGASSPGAGAG